MWTCSRCGSPVDDHTEVCGRCGNLKAGRAPTDYAGTAPPPPPAPEWRVAFEVFRGTWTSWNELFSRAAAFASRVGPERLISISQSEDHSDGVVTVWYWKPASGE